jgi:exosortase O
VPLLLLVLCSWWPTFPWWQRRFDSDDWVLASVAALIFAGISMWRSPRSSQPLPTWLWVSVSVVAVLATWWLRVPTIRAAGACLLAWTTLLLVRGLSWRHHMTALMLGLAALPTRTTIDIWCGWPLRRTAAQLVAWLLGGRSVESLLAIEGRFVDVTEKCAGIASLHLLVVGLLAAAVWQQRTLWRSGLAVIAAVIVAVLGNTMRILALTVLAVHPDLADVVHQPLGVLSFAAAMVVGLVVLDKRVGAVMPPTTVASTTKAWWSCRFAVVCLGGATLAVWMAPPPTAVTAPTIELSSLLEVVGAETMALSPSERALFVHGAVVAKGAAAGGVQLLVVASRDPRHHHEPERCLAASGQTTLIVGHVPIDDAVSAHWVHLEGADAFTVYVAADRTIADPSARWIDSVHHPDTAWVALTLLFPTTPGTSAVAFAQSTFPPLIRTAQRLLNSKEQP